MGHRHKSWHNLPVADPRPGCIPVRTAWSPALQDHPRQRQDELCERVENHPRRRGALSNYLVQTNSHHEALNAPASSLRRCQARLHKKRERLPLDPLAWRAGHDRYERLPWITISGCERSGPRPACPRYGWARGEGKADASPGASTRSRISAIVRCRSAALGQRPFVPHPSRATAPGLLSLSGCR